MNCKSARKFLYAFADGQLDVTDNCEVLDHLKMCPGCGAVVAEHQSMRTVLTKYIERVSNSFTSPIAPQREGSKLILLASQGQPSEGNPAQQQLVTVAIVGILVALVALGFFCLAFGEVRQQLFGRRRP